MWEPAYGQRPQSPFSNSRGPEVRSHVRNLPLRCFEANHWRRSREFRRFQEQRAIAMHLPHGTLPFVVKHVGALHGLDLV